MPVAPDEVATKLRPLIVIRSKVLVAVLVKVTKRVWLSESVAEAALKSAPLALRLKVPERVKLAGTDKVNFTPAPTAKSSVLFS